MRYALVSPAILFCCAAAGACAADATGSRDYLLAAKSGNEIEIQAATISIADDGTVTASLHGGEGRDLDGAGRLIGDRLIYATREWTDFGLTQMTVVAVRTADGGFVGTLHRSRNGVAVESGPLTVRPVASILTGAKP
jgi:hypothetical protein